MTRVRTDNQWELLARQERPGLPRAVRELDAAQEALVVRADSFGLPNLGAGYRWEDMQGAAAQAGGISALTSEPYRDTGFEMFFFRHNQTDVIHWIFQMSHGYVPGTPVKFHMHVIPCGAGTGVVFFSYRYFVAKVGTVIPSLASWGSATQSKTFAPADLYQHAIIPSIEIPMVGMEESSIVLVTVARVPGSDTYEGAKADGTASANVALLSADLHYQVGAAGTVNEFPGA